MILRSLARMAAYMTIMGAVIILPHAIAYAVVPEPTPARVSAPIACPTEDSVKCFWDASEQGNGLGEDVFN